ncbi:hypothetical protein HYFRA_00009201 [Hymenoscyphus fraxineus]|uniref:Cupin type-1 domain-containing protein n=1 Tax=Hymenoscyphus fraxineus TaxID=746836 RepID=A0A9N9PU25_9HELO|nr:hypothetical protein HYFRA_00009201 [Hymenoscyphus fraxineus]
MAPLSLVSLLVAGAGLVLSAPTGTAPAPATNTLLGYNPANGVINVDTDNIPFSLVPHQTEAATIGTALDFTDTENPQPIRGTKGGLDPGPQTPEYSRLNPDRLAPPGTDHGAVDNAQWPLGLSHAKLGLGRAGWSRQQNAAVLPAATEMAGVDMRLEEGGYRELHWHKAAEWAYILNGSARIQAMNEDGQTFVDDLSAGDVWFFPPGVPHSLQGLKGGVEFILIFDTGEFSEDNTFLASEVFVRNPKDILSKTLGVPLKAWDNIPAGELFIFPGTNAPADIQEQNVVGSAGIVPVEGSYSYHFSKQPNTIETEGGSVKIVDPKNFPIASMVSAALVTVKPGAIREIHWHASSDEWNYFISGSARIGIYAAANAAQTFDYNPGDTGYIPKSMTHYVENTGKTDLVFLEVLKADHFSDISVGQWLALTPSQIVQDTLNVTNATTSAFKKEKQYIVPGVLPQ